jgi:hypothetical protein
MTPDLERELRTLSAVIEFPPTPDLAGAVERRLGASAAPRRSAPARPRSRWRWRTVLLAAALLLLLAAAAGAAAYRLWLDVPSVLVREVAAVPEVPPGAGLGLGERTTVEAAAAAAGFELLPPSDPRLGEPDAVYLADVGQRPRVSLVWRARDDLPALPPLTGARLGAVLTAFPGGTPDELVIEKMASQATSVEAVDVGDGAAWWLEGAPHLVVFETPGGDVEAEERRLAGNVLLWEQGGLVLRLEAQVERDVALAIARSVPEAGR